MVPDTSSLLLSFTRTGTPCSMRRFRYFGSSKVCSGGFDLALVEGAAFELGGGPFEIGGPAFETGGLIFMERSGGSGIRMIAGPDLTGAPTSVRTHHNIRCVFE